MNNTATRMIRSEEITIDMRIAVRSGDVHRVQHYLRTQRDT